MNANLHQVDTDIDEIPLPAIIKRSLHEIGPADRNQIAGHLGLHKDDLAKVSKSLNYLRTKGEVVIVAGTKNPKKWHVVNGRNRPRDISKTPAPSAKDMKRSASAPAAAAAVTKQASPTPSSCAAAPNDTPRRNGPKTAPVVGKRQANKQGAAFTAIRDHLDAIERDILTPPTINDLQTKLAMLERLASQMNDEISAMLLDIKRDLEGIAP